MAGNRTFTEEFEALYNQVQNGYGAEDGRSNLNQGHSQQGPDPRFALNDYRGGNSRPLPNPYGASQPTFDRSPRPLPRPPGAGGFDTSPTQPYPPSVARNLSVSPRGYPQDPSTPQQGVKRLPALPPNGGGYSAYPSSGYFDDPPGTATFEKGRGAALYASAVPASRRQPTTPSPYGNVPAIDVAQSSIDSKRPENGYSTSSNAQQPSSPPYNGGAFIPPAGAQYPGYGDVKVPPPPEPVPDPNTAYNRPLPPRTSSHTARTMSTNTIGSMQSSTGSGRYYESPNTITSPNQLLAPGTTNGKQHSGDDFDMEALGATLLRTSSATSSISTTSFQPGPGTQGGPDRSSLSPSTPSHLDSTTSPSRYNSGYSPGGGITPTSQSVNFELIPPAGSDVKLTLDQLHPDEKTRRYEYDTQDQHQPENPAYNDHISDLKQRLGLHDADQEPDEYPGADAVEGYFDEDEEEDDSRFLNLALLSHIAVRLRDRVPRATHVKGSIPYPRAFTGKDIVSTIQSIIQRELLISLNISTNDRRVALQVAKSLQDQLFFYEVEWGGRAITDSVEDVYAFLDDVGEESEAGPSNAGRIEVFSELPTGVITILTKCYSPSCSDESPCYSYSCPKRRQVQPTVLLGPTPSGEPEKVSTKRGWKQTVPQEIIDSIGEREVRRQNIIYKMIEKEEQYIQDLDFIESAFIKGIRNADPPVIPYQDLDQLIDDIFGNILDLRETNKRLLETMYVRQREQKPVIQKIGDIFLTAAAEFRLAYPNYIGHLPVAEKRLKDETEHNAEFRLFLEQVARNPESRRLDLKHFITRPHDQLKNYPVLLEAALKETEAENPDTDFLHAAAQAIKNLGSVAQLRTFQNGMARNPNGPKEWYQLVSKEILEESSKQDTQRQSIMFELIYTEMEFVRDLETIDTLFVRPLTNANPPIIPRERLNGFIRDVFWNVAEVLTHHRRLLERFHEIQREEHPFIRSLTAPLMDAALNWGDAYMEYVPHYPIGAFRIQEELANNPAFKAFHDNCLRHPDSRKLDMKAFIFRPIPRLLRYDLLLQSIKKTLPPGHDDLEAIPNVLEIIKDLGKATESGVATAERKVELWNYHSNLVFKPGEAVDMDLLDETRTLVHTGRLLRQPDGSLEWSGWTELFVILFDNYVVMTKPKEKDGVTRYYANKRPIPLELLSLVGFSEMPQQRSVGLFGRGLRGGRGDNGPDKANNNQADANNAKDSVEDSRTVYPCSIHHAGRVGGLYHLFAESAATRAEWKQKLEEAISLRTIVQESNKVFETRNLSENTFVVPSIMGGPNPAWSGDMPFTGKVTCSVPFSTADGRGLVAVGCQEGVWIGLRSDKNSLRRVLHLKMVTQCAMLEDFGIFLVLADKSLFAYHIEALVPSAHSPNAGGSRTPQKLNGTKDVQFFSVGTLNGRTLIIYMKKKGLDSVFRVLEPVIGKITEKAKAPAPFGRNFFGAGRSDWFRIYRDFFLPSESFDLVFLKAKIAILCTKGFEIMDLTDFKSVTIPRCEDARLQALAKRCESCRPMGMFRSSENEFLLCYDEFGLYVDRHGDPNRTNGIVEWEGTAERVAFHPPYVVIFDQRFIEIRHIEKGQLVQIIRGTDIRCLWDGRGSALPPLSTPGPGGWDEASSLDARIHAVWKAPDPQPNSKVAVQHVFELVPTVPLYNPSTSNQQIQGAPSMMQGMNGMVQTQYYQPGFGSPPQSPAMQTWR